MKILQVFQWQPQFSLGQVIAPKNAQTILTSSNQSSSSSRNVDPTTFFGGSRFVDRVSQTDRVVVILEEELERPSGRHFRGRTRETVGRDD